MPTDARNFVSVLDSRITKTAKTTRTTLMDLTTATGRTEDIPGMARTESALTDRTAKDTRIVEVIALSSSSSSSSSLRLKDQRIALTVLSVLRVLTVLPSQRTLARIAMGLTDPLRSLSRKRRQAPPFALKLTPTPLVPTVLLDPVVLPARQMMTL
jgi:hypothetical protein